uniref:catechol O-methyltransferase n=1 Tax=Aureoumbra lagunensis TaxID=44058 RepID=A0A7S3K3I5_9STRA|mmetsp:Transcript_14073/g.21243  ORF Transcript_14073/g.21243 Transcript_14073/m.21243 type:complete len:265 (-) Transcript_14073:95-889(-)
MDLFADDDSSQDNDDRDSVNLEPVSNVAQRPSKCGVLSFHQGTEEALLNEIEQQTSVGDVTSILQIADMFCEKKHWMMLVGPEKGRIVLSALEQAVHKHESIHCLEIGSYVGYGSALIASALRQNDTLLTLDIDAQACAWTKRLLVQAGLEHRVTIRNDNVTSLRDNETFNFVFIDHDKSLYLSDLQIILPHLASGAVVVADNVLCFDNGLSMRNYMDFVRNHTDGPFSRSQLYPASLEYSFGLEPDGLEVSIFTDDPSSFFNR